MLVPSNDDSTSASSEVVRTGAEFIFSSLQIDMILLLRVVSHDPELVFSSAGLVTAAVSLA
jgi:hypothetical protein